VNGRFGRLAPVIAALAAGALLAIWAPPLLGAQSEPALRARSATLAEAEKAALLQLYAAESARARAEAELVAVEARSTALADEEQTARKLTEIARRSLAASHELVAATLKALYVEGEADPIAVILGATSLDEVVAGIESLGRAAARNRQLARHAQQQAARLAILSRQLADRRLELDAAVTQARAATARMQRAVTDRAATVAAARAEAGVNERRLRELERRANAAHEASSEINAAPTATTSAENEPSQPAVAEALPESEPVEAPASVLPGPGETTTLVVDAVAYHLPGNTASGIPVGPGVIAVDPSVIPLGTRVFVPGYGPAVAADTGSAIRGNIIDLWMPSTPQAAAWGRRTVTITIYG
jgi:3D (Asp-Asp-Asp) domain-containing protein/septal ring factor EnvC (AmiA/AmiB activator)